METSKDTSENIKNKTISNMIWRFAERSGAQAVNFFVSLILSRILLPEDFGIVALISVFINILNVFVDSGLGNALIQKKDATTLDYSTVFYFNLFSFLILYLLLFFLSPLIANFYNNPKLSILIRVLGISLFISAIKNVLHAYISKSLIFKKFFFATLGGSIGAAIIGILMALKGFGVWALVTQQLFNIFVDTIILWIVVKWRPILRFSFNSLKTLFSYGSKLLFASLINTIYREARQLVIGKLYTPEDLAFYNKGNHFPELIVTNINTSIDSVLFPVMSKEQNDIESIRKMVRKSIMMSGYIMWPLLLGLAAIGKTLIPFLITEKWTPCIPFLYISCIIYGFEPIATANLNAIKALGRSDYILRMEIIKKSVGFCIILVAMRFGVMAIALSGFVYSIFSQLVNSYPNKKLLKYNYLSQIKDLTPSLMLSLIMAIPVYFMNEIPIHPLYVIILQILTGAIIYISLSAVFKLESFIFTWQTIKSYLFRK